MKRSVLEGMLGGQFILYGEWLYAKHSVHYRNLPHYFFEFDIYDKDAGQFLDLQARLEMLDGTGAAHLPDIVATSRRTRCNHSSVRQRLTALSKIPSEQDRQRDAGGHSRSGGGWRLCYRPRQAGAPGICRKGKTKRPLAASEG